jgi:hypothetical protein
VCYDAEALPHVWREGFPAGNVRWVWVSENGSSPCHGPFPVFVAGFFGVFAFQFQPDTGFVVVSSLLEFLEYAFPDQHPFQFAHGSFYLIIDDFDFHSACFSFYLMILE